MPCGVAHTAFARWVRRLGQDLSAEVFEFVLRERRLTPSTDGSNGSLRGSSDRADTALKELAGERRG